MAGGKKTQTSTRLEERFMPWVIVAFLLNWKAAEVKEKRKQKQQRNKTENILAVQRTMKRYEKRKMRDLENI
jgi:hypothetical protein